MWNDIKTRMIVKVLPQSDCRVILYNEFVTDLFITENYCSELEK